MRSRYAWYIVNEHDIDHCIMIHSQSRFRFVASLSPLALLCALAACGGGGGSGETTPAGEASLRTLAYVVTSCHEDAQRSSFRQSLRIQRGAAARGDGCADSPFSPAAARPLPSLWSIPHRPRLRSCR